MTKLFTLGSLIIVAAALPCNARTAQPAESGTRLRLMGGRPVVDDLYIDGQGPFRFLLDTGAATNQVDAALARKLGLEASFQVELASVGGTTHVKGGRVAKVTLGTAEAANQEFLFTTLDGVHALSPSIQGVVVTGAAPATASPCLFQTTTRISRLPVACWLSRLSLA